MADKISKEDKFRLYKLKLGAHKLKNRSSKTILKLHHLDRYNIYRHVSKDQLQTWSDAGDFEASYELNRRIQRQARREANKAK